jgi:chromate reductase
MASFDIAVLVGSLRAGALSRMAANALCKLAPETLRLEIVEIGALPLYNEDIEADPPASWTAFRERLRAADGVLFVTPEYNRSMPAALKNAIDVGSRPYGSSVWDGKPGGVASVSPGAIGGFGANHAVRQAVVFLNVPMMPAPEAYWGQAGTFFDENGALINDATRKVMTRFVQAYAGWVERLAGPR